MPQGSNLGPYLFLLYVSGIHKALEGSQFLMRADDLKFYREIRDEHDQEIMQRDFKKLANRSDRKKLPCNIIKCDKMTVTRKSNPVIIN